MASSRLITGFTRYPDDLLDTKAREIIQSMTGNPHFVTPVPSLAEVETALNAYQHALAQAGKGGTEKTAIKKQKRQELEALLKRLASYVEDTALGNELALLRSGFDFAKTPEPVGILAKPVKIRLSSGPVPGSVKVMSDSVDGASTYLFECAPLPANEHTLWDKQVSTSRNFTFVNLVRGKEYVFRVAGVGANPLRVYSDSVNIIVQ